MKVVKYNRETKKYGKPFEVNTTIAPYTPMEQEVQCPRCMGKTTYGESINAGEYYEPKGIWRVCICPKCAEEVWAEDLARHNEQTKEGNLLNE